MYSSFSNSCSIIDPRSVVQVAAASMVEAVVGGQNSNPYIHHPAYHPIKSEPNESTDSSTLKTEQDERKGNYEFIWKNLDKHMN